MRIFIIIFVSYFGVLNGLETFYMEEYCGGTIDMFTMMDEFNGRLSVDGSYVGDCNVTIEASITDNRLNFYFEDFDLGIWEANCQNTFLTVYDGQNTESSTSPRMHGLHKQCGSKKPHGNYASNSRYVTFRYFNTDTTNNNHFDIIFTAFHKGYCFSNEYECSNGRCIDDSVNCNGFNPCGDGSDCRLSSGAIVGIVLGSLFTVCVFIALTYVIVKNRCKKRRQVKIYSAVGQPPFPPAYEASPSTIIRAISPPPNYGMATQYSTAANYQTITSIQGDK